MKLIAGGIIALILFLIGFSLWQAEWEQVTTETGLSREGRQQPWLAVQQLLALHDKTFKGNFELTQFSTTVRPLLTADTALLINEASFVYDEVLDQQLLDWVLSGGHLLYEFSAEQHDVVANNVLFQRVPVEVSFYEHPVAISSWFWRKAAHNTLITLPSGNYSAYIVPAVEMTNCEESDVVAQHIRLDSSLLCQYSVGQGKITFATSFSFVQNTLLDRNHHAALTLALLKDDTTVLQLNTPFAKPWWMQLWQWNAPLLLMLLLTLVFALWRLSQRFGAVQPVYSGRSLSFHLHLLALSEYLQGHGDKPRLNLELLKDLHASYDKRFPGFLQWTPEQQHQTIAKHSGIPEQQIRHLLEAPWPQHEHDRLSYLQLWQQLRNSK